MTDLAKKLAQVVLSFQRRGRDPSGQTVLSYICAVCGKDFAHANTGVPLLCPGCERDVRALASRETSPDEWIAVFTMASLSQQCARIEKFSGSTNPGDIRSPEMSDEMRTQVTTKTIGNVWRARIGRQRRWHYAWTPLEATKKALTSGGVTLTATSQLERELDELERTNPEVGAAARQLDQVKHDIIAGKNRG